MNSFYEHHKDSIRFAYRCFDRILLNGLIQPFQQPKRVIGFFDTYRQLYPVSRQTLGGIADRFQQWLKMWSEKRNIPVLDAPKGRRDEFVEPYFKGAKPDEVVAVLKAREPARIMIAIGDKAANRWHLQFAQRWVVQYNFYVNDRQWGRMFVRVCPYLPFSARVYLNQHHWLANRMREEGIDFRQCSNAFMICARPDRLRELADQLTAHDLIACSQKWLARFTPFFTASEREHAGCQHRLFFAQVVRFTHIAAGNGFTTAELYPMVREALGAATDRYTLASLRYDLSKLRAKGLVEKLPRSRRYRLLACGYSTCLVFLKLFERIYAPLTAGFLSPVRADARLDAQNRSQLDRLYQRVVDDLDKLIHAVGLKAA